MAPNYLALLFADGCGYFIVIFSYCNIVIISMYWNILCIYNLNRGRKWYKRTLHSECLVVICPYGAFYRSLYVIYQRLAGFCSSYRGRANNSFREIIYGTPDQRRSGDIPTSSGMEIAWSPGERFTELGAQRAPPFSRQYILYRGSQRSRSGLVGLRTWGPEFFSCEMCQIVVASLESDINTW